MLRTGEPELIPEVPDAVLESVARDLRHLEILRAVGFRSLMTVPVRVPSGSVSLTALTVTVCANSQFEAVNVRLVGHADNWLSAWIVTLTSSVGCEARTSM